MNQFQAFARSGKNHGVFADDIALANRLSRNLFVDPARLFSESRPAFSRFRSARLFHHMMCLDDLQVELFAKHSRRLVRERESAFTPTLKFEAKTIGNDLAASSIVFFCSAE